MKTKLFILIFSSSLLFFKSQAQGTYNQGDILANTIVNASHDSSTCSSTAFCSYNITINNSFVGDEVVIKDQQSGNIFFSSTNTNGQNPWYVSFPGFPSSFSDENIASSGGNATFFWPDVKIISGTDTIYNVSTFYQIPVTNPCSFGLVSGKIYIDYNNDCIFNGSDVALSLVISNGYEQLSSPTGSMIRSGYSDANGYYSINMQNSWMTSYQVSLSNNYAFIFPSTACSPLIYNYNTLPQANVNFSLQCTSIIDVQGSASHPSNARPNIPFFIFPKVSNTGCDSAAGVLTLIKDPNTIYNATLSTNPATSVNGDTLKWNYANLTNLSNGAYWNSFMAGVYLTPNNSVNIGDTLCFSVSTTLMSNDVDASNNQYSFCLPVVNSYDPNAKSVLPRGTGIAGNIPPSTTDLTYTVQFQNTGTAPAYNVAIIDTLDGNIDPKSINFLSSSHTLTPEWLSPNVVKFNFYNINLADSFSNEAASHGQIKFQLKLKSGIALGTQIKNTAHIYFDNNPAIVTNTTLNTIANPNGISFLGKDNSIYIYPNPTSDFLNVNISGANSNRDIKLSFYNLNGQCLHSTSITEKESKIDVSNLKAGLYFIQIKDGDSVSMQKFIKE